MRSGASLPIRAAVLALGLVAAAPTVALAQEVQDRLTEMGGDGPMLLEAEELVYEQETDVVTATGSVEITDGERILLADRVSYDRRRGIVTADGNIVLLEPTGEVLFADHVRLTDDLREGVIEQIRVLLEDDSRFAAAGAERTGGNRTVMSRAVYSPCDVCEDDPERPPLWQVKARRVIHDQDAREITYRDASLEVAGVPVFYTPWLSHPDPTVDRKSGFLAPSFGSDTSLGFFTQVPYYWTFSPNSDLTLSPIIMTEELPVAAGEFRHLFPFGLLNVDASMGILDRRRDGVTERNVLRGHFRAEGEFDIDETWRASGQIYQASDDTYLRRLNIDNVATLRNIVQVEGFHDRSYTSTLGFHVEDQRQTRADTDTPLVLPQVGHHYRSRPKQFLGGEVRADADALALFRGDGTESRRASLGGSWHLPLSTNNGQLLDLSTELRGDIYQVDRPGGDPKDDGFFGRIVPRIGAEWRWPWIRPIHQGTVFVEPRASVTISPPGNNPSGIPNEDSQALEFDETNLFRSNRFPGLDRVDDGFRVNYGFTVGALLPEGRRVSMFLGQSFREGASDTFRPGSGLDGNLSDIIGVVEAKPTHWMDILYRFRLKEGSLDFSRNEVGFSVGPDWLRLSGNYVFLETNVGEGDLGDVEEQANATLALRIDDNWSTFASHRHDFAGRGQLSSQLGLTYRDECVTASLTFTRDFTQTTEFGTRDTILLRIVLKNLGEIQTSQGVAP